MEAFLISTGLVAVAEIGDKTQLLALLLAARFRKPWPIIAGIFLATLLNHALAAGVGAAAAALLQGPWMRWVLGFAFLAFGAWALVPDKMDEEEEPKTRPGMSIFWTTTIAFFLVEMGDKTQVATAALGARFQDVALVAAGTTLGMMIANVPAVYLGRKIIEMVSLRLVHGIAAAIFAVLGVLTLFNVGKLL